MSLGAIAILDVFGIACGIAVIFRAPALADALVRRDERSPLAGNLPWRASRETYTLTLRLCAGLAVMFAAASLAAFVGLW